MPMIEVYAAEGTFRDTHRLATELATALVQVEGVPDLPMFCTNTAAFVHDVPEGRMPSSDLANGAQLTTDRSALPCDEPQGGEYEVTAHHVQDSPPWSVVCPA
jgi:hypothetical protein